jgi:hypothetical protein
MWLACAVRDGPGRRADRTGQRLESWYEENAMTATLTTGVAKADGAGSLELPGPFAIALRRLFGRL